MPPRKGIPDRWLNYVAIGRQVSFTRFLPFKCPLKESLCAKVPPRDRFTPSLLLRHFPSVGMVIDLTNTFRYYDPAELTQHHVQHVKIKCEGHGTVPGPDVVRRFFDAVDQFLQDVLSSSADSEKQLIGVHCTHGLNRTGYLICKYMVDRMGFTPQEAVHEFEKARGHKIERTIYLEALNPADHPQRRALLPAPPLEASKDFGHEPRRQRHRARDSTWSRSWANPPDDENRPCHRDRRRPYPSDFRDERQTSERRPMAPRRISPTPFERPRDGYYYHRDDRRGWRQARGGAHGQAFAHGRSYAHEDGWTHWRGTTLF